LQVASSFRAAIVASAAVAVTAAAGGLGLSLALNIPASAAIVLLCFLAFVILFLVKKGRGVPPAAA
jgi:ABC-type Mn2+/Zn2+ transport system permease subunit